MFLPAIDTSSRSNQQGHAFCAFLVVTVNVTEVQPGSASAGNGALL
jgi:hypothetical protein